MQKAGGGVHKEARGHQNGAHESIGGPQSNARQTSGIKGLGEVRLKDGRLADSALPISDSYWFGGDYGVKRSDSNNYFLISGCTISSKRLADSASCICLSFYDRIGHIPEPLLITFPQIYPRKPTVCLAEMVIVS